MPGESGNPAGRPGGSGKRAEARRLLDEGAAEAVRKALAMAKRGDRAMLRLVVERVVPRAGRMGEGGPEEAAGTTLERVRGLIRGVDEGRISIEEARERGKLLELERKTMETMEIADRLERVEAELRRPRGEY